MGVDPVSSAQWGFEKGACCQNSSEVNSYHVLMLSPAIVFTSPPKLTIRKVLAMRVILGPTPFYVELSVPRPRQRKTLTTDEYDRPFEHGDREHLYLLEDMTEVPSQQGVDPHPSLYVKGTLLDSLDQLLERYLDLIHRYTSLQQNVGKTLASVR